MGEHPRVSKSLQESPRVSKSLQESDPPSPLGSFRRGDLGRPSVILSLGSRGLYARVCFVAAYCILLAVFASCNRKPGDETLALQRTLLGATGRVLKAEERKAFTPLGGAAIAMRNPQTGETISLTSSLSQGEFNLDEVVLTEDQLSAVLSAKNKTLQIVVSKEGYITIERTLDLSSAQGKPPVLAFVLQEKGDTRAVLPPGGGPVQGPDGRVVVHVQPAGLDVESLFQLVPILTQLALVRELPTGFRMLGGAHMEVVAAGNHGSRKASRRKSPPSTAQAYPFVKTDGLVPDSVLSKLKLMVLDPAEGWVDRGGRFIRDPVGLRGEKLPGYVGPDLFGPDGELLSGDEEAPSIDLNSDWALVYKGDATYTFSGVVRDQAENLLPQATVMGGGSIAMTDASGSFVLPNAVPDMAPMAGRAPKRSHLAGDSVIPVSAEKPGYLSSTVLASTANPFGLTIVLVPAAASARISGAVKRGDGSPVSKLAVLLGIAPGYPEPDLVPYVGSDAVRGQASDLEEGEIRSSAFAWTLDGTAAAPARRDVFASSIRLGAAGDGNHRVALSVQDSETHTSKLEREVVVTGGHIISLVPAVLPPKVMEVSTSADGSFAFSNVPAGTPAVVFLRGPFRDWQPVAVAPLEGGQEFTVDFAVVPDPPAENVFMSAVRPLFESKNCLTCHNSSDQADGVDLSTAQRTLESMTGKGNSVTRLLLFFDKKDQGEIYYWIQSVDPALRNLPPKAGPIALSPSNRVEVHETVSFSAPVSDPDGDAMQVVWASNLQEEWNNPEGILFQESIIGNGTSQFSLEPKKLKLGDHAITVKATDAGGKTASAGVALTVYNTIPTAQVVFPEANHKFCITDPSLTGQVVGSAFDPYEQGAALKASWFYMYGNNYKYYLTYDQPMEPGPDGTSLSSPTVTVYPDTTAIGLDVKDSFGAVGSNSVPIFIGNAAPTAIITKPTDGASFKAFDVIEFEAKVTDECNAAETITGTWVSQAEGTLFSAKLQRLSPSDPLTGVSRFKKQLKPGRHMITFTAKDPAGKTGSAMVIVNVIPILAISVADGYPQGSLNYDNTKMFVDDFGDSSYLEYWYDFLPTGLNFPVKLEQSGGFLVTELGSPSNPIPAGTNFVSTGLTSRFVFPDRSPTGVVSLSFTAQADLQVDSFTFGNTDFQILFVMDQFGTGEIAQILCGADTNSGTQKCDLTGSESNLNIKAAKTVPAFKGKPMTLKMIYDQTGQTLTAEVYVNNGLVFTETAKWYVLSQLSFSLQTSAKALNQSSYVKVVWDKFETNLKIEGFYASLTPMTASGLDYVTPKPSSTLFSQVNPNFYSGRQYQQAVSANNSPILFLTGDKNLNVALVSLARGGFALPYQTFYTGEKLTGIPVFTAGYPFFTDVLIDDVFLAKGFGSSYIWALGSGLVNMAGSPTTATHPAVVAPFGIMLIPSDKPGTSEEEIFIDNLNIEICPSLKVASVFTGQKPTFSCSATDITSYSEDFETSGASVWTFVNSDAQPADPNGTVKLEVVNGSTRVSKPTTTASSWDVQYRGAIMNKFGSVTLPPDQAWALNVDLRFGASNAGFAVPLPILFERGLNLGYLSNNPSAGAIAFGEAGGGATLPSIGLGPHPIFPIEDLIVATTTSKPFLQADTSWHTYRFEFYPDIRHAYLTKDGAVLVDKRF